MTFYQGNQIIVVGYKALRANEIGLFNGAGDYGHVCG